MTAASLASGSIVAADADPHSTPPPVAYESATWDHGRFTLSDGTVSEDWGVVAAPVGDGPYPLAVLLHGNHGTCPTDTAEGRTWPCPAGTEVPHHEGLAYLAEALAERGFVTIVPGINGQYTLGSGEPMTATRTAEIASRAVDELLAGELDVDPAAVDVDRLVMIGHSIGGQDAALMAAGQTTFDRPVDGVVMLQPALNDASALPLADVPAAVVVSECDGDTGLTGGSYVADALIEPRTTPVALLVLEGANHNATNTGLRADAFPVAGPGCAPDLTLAPAAQQTLLSEVVPGLAEAVLDPSSTGPGDAGGTSWARDVFAGATPPAGVLVDVIHPDERSGLVPGDGPVVDPSVTLDGLSATWCPIGYYTPFMKPGTEACHRPELLMFVGLPQTLAVSWSDTPATITVPLDATPGDTIVVRAVADVADPNLTGPGESGPSSTIRLHAISGGAVADWKLPVPAWTREEIPPFTLTHALAMWSTFTLPVPDGADDLTITIDSPSAGSLQLVSIGIVPAH